MQNGTNDEINSEKHENEVNEASLSDVKNSIATLAKKYIKDSFFDKLVDTAGISQAKEILLGDLKNMIGHGTSGKAAQIFANAVRMAKNTKSVDTILANYMLKGDGMGARIGYGESVEAKDPIEGFRKFLAESRKSQLDDVKLDEKKDTPSEEEINEAIKVAEAHGYKVTKIDEKKGCCDGGCDKKKKPTKEEIEEAIKIVEARGAKVIRESAVVGHVIECEGICSASGLKDLIDDALATGNVARDVADSIDDIVVEGESLKIVSSELGERINEALIDGISKFLENAPGIEVEVGEDVVDNWQRAFSKVE